MSERRTPCSERRCCIADRDRVGFERSLKDRRESMLHWGGDGMERGKRCKWKQSERTRCSGPRHRIRGREHRGHRSQRDRRWSKWHWRGSNWEDRTHTQFHLSSIVSSESQDCRDYSVRCLRSSQTGKKRRKTGSTVRSQTHRQNTKRHLESITNRERGRIDRGH